jgi:DNA-binding response OmpR family regulator
VPTDCLEAELRDLADVGFVVQMPGFSGWETVAALRRRPETNAIPILIVSVLGPEPGHGVDGWLQKPVEPGSLVAALESALHTGEDSRVLLVEDDADLAAVLVQRLSACGVRPVHAGTVEEALRAVADTRPDILVLDLGLPDGSGVEVIEAMRRDDTLRSVPTVVYTARDVSEAERARLRLGETEILAKGRITLEDFERRVLDLLARVVHDDRNGARPG